jgi:tetratricopeptide (TPR) repeat protein
VFFALLILFQPVDDWQIQRSPFDPRTVAKYENALEHDPDDALAFRKLVELYRKYKTVDELAGRWKAKKTWQGHAVYADILAGPLGRPKDAVTALEGAPPGQAAIDERLGRLYEKLGREPDARKAWERALGETREKKPVLRALADLAMGAKDWDAARKWFDQLVALEPGNVKIRIEYADALEKAGMAKDAVRAEVDRAAKATSNPQQKAELMLRMGELSEAGGKDEQAIADYRKGMTLLPREHYLRRELVEKLVGIYRRKDDLRSLVVQLDKEWTSKGFAEWEVLARLYDELGEQEKAENAFKKAIAAQPSALEARTRYIALLDRLGRDEDAVREYEKLVSLAPGDPKFQLALAERLLRRGEKKRGLEMLHRISARFGGDAGVHAQLADLFERYGEQEAALRETERLVALEPDDEGHIVALGEQHFQRGNKKKAQEIWKRLLVVLPKKEQAMARLAEIYADHDLTAEALDLYDKAVKLAPNDPTLRRGIAQVLERQRRIDEAVEAWKKVMELAREPAQRPLRREARTRIIAILFKERRLPPRLMPYVQAFGASPPDLEAGYFLAEAYTKMGQLEAAEKVLRKILEGLPDDVDALSSLVVVLRARHQLTDAIATLRRLAELVPSRAREFYSQIADLELLLYHDDEAIRYARRAVEMAPHDPAAHLRLAEIFEKKEDFPAAVAAYRAALAENPRLWKAQFALARLLIRGGQLREAAQVYREVLSRAPEDEIVLDAARKALDVEEYLGSLGELEKEIRPLEFAHQQKPVYRKVLLELYARYAPPLVLSAACCDDKAKSTLRGLGEHGLRPLLESLEDPDPRSQQLAASLLGYLGNKAAAPALARVAQGTPTGDPPIKPDIDVRVAATLSMGRLGEPRVVPQLVKLLGDKEVALREAAAWGLGRTQDHAAEKALVTAVGDAKPEVAALACLSLASHNGSSPTLLAVARDRGKDDLVRAACAYALGRAGDAQVAPQLGAILESGGGETQRAAARALGLLGARSADRELVHAVYERRDSVRDAALAALCGPRTAADVELDTANGKPDASGYLSHLLDSAPVACEKPPAALAKEAPSALDAALGKHRDIVLRTLVDLDGSGDELALGPLGAPAETRGIVLALAQKINALLAHEDAGIRLHAMRVLAKLGQPIGPAIVRAAGDGNLDLARGAADAARLLVMRKPELAPTLAAALAARLTSPSWTERAAAARALGSDPRLAGAARPALETAAHDDVGFVREAATTALTTLTSGAHPLRSPR